MLRLGRLSGKPVAVLMGRQHAYETGEAHAMKGAIRTLAALGCQVLLQTNAAGSLDVAMQPGECMGACADAPVLLVNDRNMCSYMSHDKIDQLIDGLRAVKE